MKKQIIRNVLIFITLVLSSCLFPMPFKSLKTEEVIPFRFSKNIEFHYNALYIDSENETITNELLILKVLGKRWFVQPGLQEAIRYIYHTDTSDYRNYSDPFPFFRQKNEKYYERKGKARRLSKKETTGAYSNSNNFYAHPPRANQYRMLFYAPHPIVPYQLLKDTLCEFVFNRKIVGSPFTQTYQYSPTKNFIMKQKEYKCWEVNVNSIGNLHEYMDSLAIYNSKLEALFCEEIGFVKMNYTFQDSTKILFKLTKVIEIKEGKPKHNNK